MPPPPCSTPYSLHDKSLLKASEEICSKTLSTAAKEISDFKGYDGITNFGVSCDGTLQQ